MGQRAEYELVKVTNNIGSKLSTMVIQNLSVPELIGKEESDKPNQG
jgi:hypothetical protein